MANQEYGAKSTSHGSEASKPKAYVRFTLAQRAEHILLIGSFTLLALTGLPQKFVGNGLAEAMIAFFGGIETIRAIHHVSAIVFLLEGVYHFVVVAYKVIVRRVAMTMLPGLKDAIDAIDQLRHNLGVTKELPHMPRYNFAEKAEYWAMLWGGIVMALTGFMLWNPIFTAKLLPGQFIPAAKAAHGGEAVLAALAIIVWHFYNVHLKAFNKSMFTGRLTRHEMAEEHGAELDMLDSGVERPQVPQESIRKRERVFFPIAFVLATVLVVGLFWLATFETTAIETISPTQATVFVPLTPTPVPAVTSVQIGAVIPHSIEGREDCVSCHGEDGIRPFPPDHAGRTNDSCQICHQPAPAGTGTATTAPTIPHSISTAVYQNCTVCHGAGQVKPMPDDHSSYKTSDCTLCHQESSSSASSGTETVTGNGLKAAPEVLSEAIDAMKSTPESQPTESGETSTVTGTGLIAIPQSLVVAIDRLKSLPEGHPAVTEDSCATCHQITGATAVGSTPTAASSGPNAIPHAVDLAGFSDCSACHAAGQIAPYPDDHASFNTSSCTACHQAPAATTETTTPAPKTPPTIAHSITAESFSDCLACHGAGEMAPVPDNHTGFGNSTCVACHPTGIE